MARMIVYCRHCAETKGWPIPAVRVTDDACSVCGGHDAIRTMKVHPRTGEVKISVIQLKNFEHHAALLPGTLEEAKLQNINEE